MSMLDAFFNKGSRAAKCKTLLKLAIPRIKLLRNRREIQLKQMRKDIAKLLENGQEATARIRVEHIIREENIMAAQEILELFCELITVRLPIIETQRECPLDLKEAISSVCFAAPRSADLPELLQVQMFFTAKYGKEFVTAATELLPDCGVNRQIIELLSIRAPSVESKLKLLKEIAEEHEVDWDPSATETEFLKPHEDLLNGPPQFMNGSSLPLPPQKHIALSSVTVNEAIKSDSDEEFDLLGLPEVPKDSVRAAFDGPLTTENDPDLQSYAHDIDINKHELNKSIPKEDFPFAPPMEHAVNSDPSDASLENLHLENRKFIPFVTPPSFPSFVESSKQNDRATQPVPSSADLSSKQSEPDLSIPPLPSFQEHLDLNEKASSTKQSDPISSASLSANKMELQSSLLWNKSEIRADLQDVLVAAQSAAETAERAAVAARAAANLAQVKISELVAKSSSETSESSLNELPEAKFQQYSFGRNDTIAAYDEEGKIESPTIHSGETLLSSHVPQRLPSLEDDPYFSYPNLFSSKDADVKSVHDLSNHT
ncbi:IST1 homolog [Zingiber officinale]|uniref:IST1 homolog n=1 Tax=Zingiber officinale TaxID=94328 RepID=UPI001C4BE5AE|nr:IST1 homolog [Zingiber officinale]